jgi:hypothetical protein
MFGIELKSPNAGGDPVQLMEPAATEASRSGNQNLAHREHGPRQAHAGGGK